MYIKARKGPHTVKGTARNLQHPLPLQSVGVANSMGRGDSVERDFYRLDVEFLLQNHDWRLVVGTRDFHETFALKPIQASDELLRDSELLALAVGENEPASTGVGDDGSHARDVQPPHINEVRTHDGARAPLQKSQLLLHFGLELQSQAVSL